MSVGLSVGLSKTLQKKVTCTIVQPTYLPTYLTTTSYYSVLSAVVGTTSSCDMIGFEASGGRHWQEGLSLFCHILDTIILA